MVIIHARVRCIEQCTATVIYNREELIAVSESCSKNTTLPVYCHKWSLNGSYLYKYQKRIKNRPQAAVGTHPMMLHVNIIRLLTEYK